MRVSVTKRGTNGIQQVFDTIDIHRGVVVLRTCEAPVLTSISKLTKTTGIDGQISSHSTNVAQAKERGGKEGRGEDVQT